ncbi:MAG: L-aspartate oxidase [Cyanophyceae cyanobacterium]
MNSSQAPLPLDSQRLATQFDVLVVGTGAAGLYAALCLPARWRVALITKDTLHTGASDWAQGGIAAAISPADSPQLHREDTLKAGGGLCDRAAVQFLVDRAAAAIASLVDLGVAFDRQGAQLAMTLEAAHSHPRVLHAADTTGRAIVSTLTERVLEQTNIQVLSQALALSLWVDRGRCQGISFLYRNQIQWLRCRAVILATGGGGQVFAQTTNPAVSTGDGVALAWRAGAAVRDLEFFQFHPTALTKPGAPRFLISEAVRGEGASLIDASGSRFAFDYHPAGELAPRDVVSRAIFSHLQKTAAHPERAHVYLDLQPIEPERIRRRFPNIIKVCQQWGIDVFKEPIPVAPAAHYWMGGIATDITNQTSIPGLYAIGETASTGVHGANRLASNSLLECLVFAQQLAHLELEAADVPVGDVTTTTGHRPLEAQLATLRVVRAELPRLMWESAGICRSQVLLEKAIARVQSWREEVAISELAQYLFLSPTHSVDLEEAAAEQVKAAAETFNLLDIAYLILKSAAFRQESRGGHYRTDYPHPSPDWQVHTVVHENHWQKAPLNQELTSEARQ